ncbi:MAG: glycosyltransferase family 2 protein [Selenomonadaceae bacterium]|nr:glycosyltransferase family 2 protein [Selenomonadaceae bacterium]
MSKSKKSKSKTPKHVAQKSMSPKSSTPKVVTQESTTSKSTVSKSATPKSGTSPQISIIVPFFNDKKFIKTCIDSVLTQTFQDFELILIDDCSTDHSYIELNQQYAQESRVKLFRNVNHLGYDVTRSFGITHARGKYIYFMDADGAILPNMLETFINAAEESGAEVVLMNDAYTTEDEFFEFPARIKIKKRPFKNPKPRFFSDNIVERFEDEFFAETCNLELWTRIQRRDFLLEHGISFPKTQRNGYLPFYIAELCHAKKIQVIDGCCYIKRLYEKQSTESLTNDLKLSILSMPVGLKYIRENFSSAKNISKEEISSLESQAMHLYSEKNFDMLNKFNEMSAQLDSIIRDAVLTSNICEPECVMALFNILFTQKISARKNREISELFDETDIAMPKINFQFPNQQTSQKSQKSQQSQQSSSKSQPTQQSQQTQSTQPQPQKPPQKSPQVEDRFKSIPQSARLF